MAQYNLGAMYDIGDGVGKDHTEAAKWYQKATDQDHADAQFDLGQMYAQGEGAYQEAPRG